MAEGMEPQVLDVSVALPTVLAVDPSQSVQAQMPWPRMQVFGGHGPPTSKFRLAEIHRAFAGVL
jgi:hypothetical protein